MEHSEDVGRLFSWLKAPMVSYREFAPQIEVSEAVATWPLVHKTAVLAGVTGEEVPAPHGDSAIKQRMARDRAAMPAAAARAIREHPIPGTEAAPDVTPTPGGLADAPTGNGQRPRASPPEGPAAPPRVSQPEPIARVTAEPRRAAPPAAAEAASAAPARPVAEPSAAPRSSTHYAAGERGALFGGEYRGREREAAPRHRAADRQDRSLDAVFSRLSGGRDRLPDPRERARTTPGLGAVFGRLR